jgi:hypothetical protein
LVPLDQLGHVGRQRILDALDQPLVDRDPDERGKKRLRDRERGLQAPAAGAVEVALAHESILVYDEECERVVCAQELIQFLAWAGRCRVEGELGPSGQRARVRASRYPASREAALVAHVRLAPHQSPGDRGRIGRRIRPPVHARHRDEKEPQHAGRSQKPATPAPPNPLRV